MYRPPGCQCEKHDLKHAIECYTPWVRSQAERQGVNSHTCLTDPVVRQTRGAENQHHLCAWDCPGPDSEAVRQMLKAYSNSKRKGGGDDRPYKAK